MEKRNNIALCCWLCWDGKSQPSEKRREKDAVCPACYRRFVEESSDVLAAEGRDVPLPEWLKTKVLPKIGELQEGQTEMQKRYENLRDEVHREAMAGLKADVRGYIEPERFNAALRKRKGPLWQQKGGNRLHWQNETLKTAIASLTGMLNGLRRNSRESAKAQETPEPTSPEASEVKEDLGGAPEKVTTEEETPSSE